MFLPNKYHRWYLSIVAKAQAEGRKKCGDGKYDQHHIIPVSMGGTNNKSNLVLLTSKEHFLCHLLLFKCTEGKAKMSMACAWHRMATIKRYCSRQYVEIGVRHKISLNGINKGAYQSPEKRAKISASLKGRSNPAASERLKGRKLSQATKDKISKAGKGREFTMEAKEKIRQASLAQWVRYHANGNKHTPEPAEEQQ
jgi:hypothetical protein